jgi:hypothetical protein
VSAIAAAALRLMAKAMPILDATPAPSLSRP